MLNKLANIFLVLSISLFTNCMDIERLKSFQDINKTLKSVGLIPELCKIIRQYCDLAFYHQINSTHTPNNPSYTFNTNALAYCQNGKYLASGNSDGTIKIWDLDTNSDRYLSCIYTIGIMTNDCHRAKITALIYCPEINYLVSSSEDETIKVWELKTLISMAENILSKTENSDIKQVSNIDSNNKRNVNCIFTIGIASKGNKYGINEIAFCSHGKYLASAHMDIKIWDLDINSKNFKECIAVFDENNGGFDRSLSWIDSLAYCNKNKHLAAYSSFTDNIKIFDLDNKSNNFKKRIYSFNRHRELSADKKTMLLYCNNGKHLALLDRARDVHIFDLDRNSRTFMQSIKTLDCADDRANTLAYCENSKYLALGCYEDILIFDLDENSKTFMKCINTLVYRANGHHYILALAFCDNGNLASGGHVNYAFEAINLWNNMDILGNDELLNILMQKAEAEIKRKRDNSWCVIS